MTKSTIEEILNSKVSDTVVDLGEGSCPFVSIPIKSIKIEPVIRRYDPTRGIRMCHAIVSYPDNPSDLFTMNGKGTANFTFNIEECVKCEEYDDCVNRDRIHADRLNKDRISEDGV
jgi:hypothetical protein